VRPALRTAARVVPNPGAASSADSTKGAFQGAVVLPRSEPCRDVRAVQGCEWRFADHAGLTKR
jgi:hypothetical protein